MISASCVERDATLESVAQARPWRLLHGQVLEGRATVAWCASIAGNSVECAGEIRDEVRRGLDAHGETDEVFTEMSLGADVGGDGGVRHFARQADGGSDAAPTDGRTEERGGADQSAGDVEVAGFKGDERAWSDADRSIGGFVVVERRGRSVRAPPCFP